MATQFQQVLAAINDLGGRGTPKEIYAKILETNEAWGTKTPIASVSMYLSKSDMFKNDDGVWSVQESEPEAAPAAGSAKADKKPADKKPKENGLYFITVSPYIKIRGAGFLFKIGRSDNVEGRLIAYSASLPIETIQSISYYPIPKGVDLSKAEKQVSGELLGSESLGKSKSGREITVHRFFGNHQKEWLQTLDVDPKDKDELNNLARVIDTIVERTIEALTPKPEEETDE